MRNLQRIIIGPIGLLITLSIFTPDIIFADELDLDRTNRALEMIASFADKLCVSPPLKGKSTKQEISGSINAELKGIVKKIADLGITGAAKYNNSEYEGVLQADLVEIINNTNECKNEVSKRLERILIKGDTINNKPTKKSNTFSKQPATRQQKNSMASSGVDKNIIGTSPGQREENNRQNIIISRDNIQTHGENSPGVVMGNYNITNNISSKSEKMYSSGSSTNKPTLPPTTAELEQFLREQIGFLLSSVSKFDDGTESEGKRIAGIIYNLFVNTEYSPSLLEQMRIREKLLLLNTANKDVNGNLMPFIGLVVIQSGSGRPTPYIARCLTPMHNPTSSKRVNFDEWWRTVVLDDHNGVVFNRGELVITVAQQDGGIRVASGFDPSYVSLARQNGIGFMNEGGKPVLGAELHSIRQIAWEVMEAIKYQYPHFFPN